MTTRPPFREMSAPDDDPQPRVPSHERPVLRPARPWGCAVFVGCVAFWALVVALVAAAVRP